MENGTDKRLEALNGKFMLHKMECYHVREDGYLQCQVQRQDNLVNKNNY